VTRPHTAMVLAAGLGTRLRPLTLTRPKALVEVGGKALIDHMLDRLVAAGVRRAIVNVHAFADDLEAHVSRRADLEVLISDERAAPLETGGGLKRARPLLGVDPIFVCNIDSVWIEHGAPALDGLIAAWDPRQVDDVLLLAPLERTVGFDGPGDFFRDDAGALTPRDPSPTAPLAYIGAHLMDPGLIDAWPDGPHGIFPHWQAMSRAGRLHGAVLDGLWMHVGDPVALAEAEKILGAAGS